MQTIYNDFLQKGIKKENILLNEPMSKHTSFKVGGNALFFIKVYSLQDLKNIMEIIHSKEIPFFIIGNGTNLLVKDKGFNGIIIQLKFEEILINENEVTVGAGVKNAILSQKLIENELTGFEFASGIPGTIGGAIKMNAGAYGSEFQEIVEEVIYIDKQNNIKKINNSECKFQYRESIFSKNNENIIIGCKMKFYKGNKDEIFQKVLELSKKRKDTQPIEYPNAGSTFKRGKDFITAKLIEECGLKGYKIGGAEVSTKHAGFIINKQKATAKDIIDLINYVKETVKERTNKEIELEVEIIGG